MSNDGAHLPSSLFPLPFLVILLASFAVVAPFFHYGIPSGHDFEFHVNSWMETAAQWRQGIWYPRWAEGAHYGYGEARFIFYPPISWMLGAALGSVLPWKLAPGAYVWLVLTLSGCAMFALARQYLRLRHAIFAAALYAVNPYHIVIVYWRSAYAELLAAALLPLLLLSALRMESGGRRMVVPLGLIVAAAWLINAPSAVMVNYSLALLVVLMAVTLRAPRFLWYGLLAITLGAALAAFYLVPATYEQKWVDIGQVLSAGVRPQDNFLFHELNDPLHNVFNFFVSLVALAEIAIMALASIRWRRWQQQMPGAWGLLAAWSVAAALLMCSFTSLAWQHLPKLRFMQLPWRWLLCLNVGFALLVCAAWKHWLSRLAVVAAMLGVLALGWHWLQTPWWDNTLDIAELHENIRTGIGYEGTDEYVPLGADPYEIHQDARRVTFEGQGADQIHVLQWAAESKMLTATVSAPGKLVLRLFNYPAWKVEVNAQAVAAQTREVTGQMMIPVQPGENRVRILFTRTWDRTFGGWISGATVLILAGAFVFRKMPKQPA